MNMNTGGNPPPPQYQTPPPGGSPPPPYPPPYSPPSAGNPPPQYQTPPPGAPPPWQAPGWQTPPPPPRRVRHGGDFVFPLILICLGVLFLLGQMNLIQVNWSVIWPILLIAIGVGIIFNRRSTPGWLIAILVILAVVFVGFMIVPNLIPGLGMNLGETQTNTEHWSQSMIGDARTLQLKLEAPAGSVTIHPSDSGLGTTAVQIRTTSNINDLPAPVGSRTGDTYQITASYRQGPMSWLPFISPFNWGNVRLERDIMLNTTLPLALDAQMTSGNILADTTGLSIQDANFTFTSGELTWDAGTRVSSTNPRITFHFTSGRAEGRNLGSTNFREMNVEFTSGSGVFNLAGLTPGVHSLRVGITSGDIRIQVPKGVAYSVQVDRTSGSAIVDGRSFSNGERFESPNYTGATTKLDMQLGITSGSINVEFNAF